VNRLLGSVEDAPEALSIGRSEVFATTLLAITLDLYSHVTPRMQREAARASYSGRRRPPEFGF
jgi:hypothetical protein